MITQPQHARDRRPRLAVLTSHPIQYYAPLFRTLTSLLDVHVFFAHRATPEQQAAAGFGAAFDWDLDLLSGYSHAFLKNVARAPSTAQFAGCDTPEIADRLREGDFDAVLALGWHLKSLQQGIWAAKRLGLPVMIRGDSQLETPRGQLKRMAKRIAYPPLLRTFDVALFVGARNKAYFEHYAYPTSRLVASPHCVDTERFTTGASPGARAALRARLNVNGDVRLVLFAGKLLPFKRPLDVVNAVARVRSNGVNAEVMIAGSGDLDAEIRARAAASGVPVHGLGFVNQSEMPGAYAAADVLVLPSTGRETWGLVCNEALACGVPIIVSDAVGCAPDLAADNHVGRQFPVGDVNRLADALCALFSAPPGRSEILEAADRFTLRRAALGIETATALALQRRRASATPQRRQMATL